MHLFQRYKASDAYTDLAESTRKEYDRHIKYVEPGIGLFQVATFIGPVIAPTVKTDFVVLGLAIFIGGIVGILIRIPVGGFSVALGTSVGALVAGLIVGHMRTRYPLFGRLHAGPVFLPALKELGLGLLLGGVAVTLIPLLVGLFFGRYVLKMNPILLLGGLAGALTMTAGMAAVQTRSESPVAVLGYTPAYPIANILLTLWGSLIVILMTG